MSLSLTDEQEKSRLLINYVHPKSQHILRTDREFVSRAGWEKELSDPNKKLLTIPDSENRIIAVVLLTLGQGKWVDFADIRFLTVHPNWQKRGIGQELLETAEKLAKECCQKKWMGLTTVYHPDCPQEALVSWYLKLGYKFKKNIEPTDAQREDWKPEFRESVCFKSFEKTL